MSIPVWIWESSYPGGGKIDLNRQRINLGDGIIKTVMHEMAHVGYDMTGQSVSHLGTARFNIVLKAKRFTISEFVGIVRFLKDRAENGDEAFYYYNPDEVDEIDADGIVTTGRYLVKCLSDISWTINTLMNHDITELEFIEDRS